MSEDAPIPIPPSLIQIGRAQEVRMAVRDTGAQRVGARLPSAVPAYSAPAPRFSRAQRES